MAFTKCLGDDETDGMILRRVDSNVQRLVAELEADAKRRKITLIVGIASAVFAAAKLGFIALPHIKAWRESR